MDINQIGTRDVIDDNRLINRRLTQSLDRLASGVNVTSAKDDPVLWSDVQGLKSSVSKLQAYSDNLNRGATSVRIALGSMEATETVLAQLKISLESALAEPPGSSTRAERLQRYNELLPTVNDLASPPDTGARKLLDNPETFDSAGPLEIAAGDNGFTIVLTNRPIHSGADGLDLPLAGGSLPSDPNASPIIADLQNATNDEIQSMLDTLELAQDRLEAKSQGLSVDASAIELSKDYTDAIMGQNEKTVDTLNVPDLEAEAVLAQALSLRNNVSLFGLTGFQETKQLALSLLQ